MPRYKKIASLKVDHYRFFAELQVNNELVEKEITCSAQRTKNYKCAGDVFSVSYYGEKLIAIKSNFGLVRTHYKLGRKKTKVVDRKEYLDILFVLTEKGWEYIKDLITEQKIKEFI